ncbi:MAG: hypothetical protein ABIQ36_00935 [Rhodanobacter sp.]
MVDRLVSLLRQEVACPLTRQAGMGTRGEAASAAMPCERRSERGDMGARIRERPLSRLCHRLRHGAAPFGAATTASSIIAWIRRRLRRCVVRGTFSGFAGCDDLPVL